MTAGTIEIRTANCAEDYALAKNLFIEYQQFLGVDLCFQSFEEELNILPDMYGGPTGNLLLAFVENEPAGCVALRNKGHNICEMKRLYVPASFRNLGIGKLLTSEIISSAQALGYNEMVLDTLNRLEQAIHVYRQFGFEDCAPYYSNPLEGVRFMQRKLQ
jgi:ribosomal protein S18 acetylase RimI-like enzyme